MKRSIQTIIVGIMLGSVGLAQAVKIKTKRIRDIVKYVKDAPNTLIVFDIDYTIGKNNYFKIMRHPEKAFKVIDRRTPHMIRSLQRRGCKVVALTARWRRMLPMTIKQLNHNNIDFSHSDFIAKSVQPIEGAAHSKGVICCGRHNKGRILANYLRLNNYRPRRVIFADDKKKNATAVDQQMQQEGIDVVSIHYKR